MIKIFDSSGEIRTLRIYLLKRKPASILEDIDTGKGMSMKVEHLNLNSRMRRNSLWMIFV